jgi:hypothetical protein
VKPSWFVFIAQVLRKEKKKVATIDYQAVLIDLETRKAEYQDRITKIDAAIAGIKALEQPAQAQSGSPLLPFTRPVLARRGLFGRDPSQPTLAECAAAVLPQNGGPMHLSDITRRMAADGRRVKDAVLRDILTRKDTHGRFIKHGKGMFSLNLEFATSNEHQIAK